MKQLLISESAYQTICEAADILKRVYQGHIEGFNKEEVRDAYRALHAIRYEEVTAQGKAS